MFTIVIAGRPNVGKSTLFNRLAGRRLALVDDRPGLTRDRREAEIEIAGRPARLMDTAGLEEADPDTVAARMRAQSETAIALADVVVFLIDARAGVTPSDQSFAELVRRSGKPVILVANKAEGRRSDAGVYEAFSLGLGTPLAVSAEHGQGVSELLSTLAEIHDRLCQAEGKGEAGEGAEDVGPQEGRALRIAVIGRPNAGKSTLINGLLGEERLITGPEAGLTRDSIAVETVWQGRALRLFDTAGLRKKARIKDRAEHLSVQDALRAIRFAEVVVLLLDAQHPFEKQDLALADLVAQEGRALVIGLNKWDLVTDGQRRLQALRAQAERLLPQLRGVPLVTLAARERRGFGRLMRAVFDVHELWNRRVSTARLNRFLAEVEGRHTPPAIGGRPIRLRFMTQANARPPTFILFCSRPKELPASYQRYIINALRTAFDLPGVPIRLHLRKGDNPYA